MKSSIAQLVLAESGGSYLIVDHALRVLQVEGRVDILGDGQTVSGRLLLELLPELFGYESILADILAGRQTQLRIPEISRDSPNGSMRYYDLLTLAHTADTGQIDGLIQVITDVTERGIIEQMRVQQRNELGLLKDQITQQNIGLARVNTELSRTTQLKDEFLANMSHEIRTPLTAILGLTEVMQAGLVGPLSAEQLDTLDNIRDSGRHLLSLINDFLDFAKIEAGQFDLELHVVPVESICQASIRMVRELAQRKAISLDLTIQPEVHLILADERRLVQVLINLLANAIKFTPQGGSIGLDVQGYADLDQVRFTVWDTGIGISSEDILRLFKPFSQINGEYQRHYVGSGLGLVLVAQLTKLHGGGIELTSQLDQGSRFTIVLPWIQAEQQRQLDEMEASTPQHSSPAHGTQEGLARATAPARNKILLLEDDQASATKLFDYLEACGYRVTHARSGEVALALLQELVPDLIVMEVHLQGLEGLETIYQMRTRLAIQRTPIVVLTALVLPGDRERCIAAGATTYLSKPVRLPSLAEVARNLIMMEHGHAAA